MLHNTRQTTEELFKEINKSQNIDSKLTFQVIEDQDLPRVDAWFEPGKLSEVRLLNSQNNKRGKNSGVITRSSTSKTLISGLSPEQNRVGQRQMINKSEEFSSKTENQLFTIVERLDIIFLNEVNKM